MDFYVCEYNVIIDLNMEVVILFGIKIGLVELLMCLMDLGDMMFLFDLGYFDYLLGVVLGEV